MNATQLAEKHHLTQREAEVVLARKEAGSGASLEEHVEQIKSERVGPAALWEGGRTDLNVPGSGISPPSPNTPPSPQEHLADLERQRKRLDAEIERVTSEVEAAELQAATVPEVPTSEPSEEPRVWSDTEIRDANAADLVAYVAAQPGEAHRVRRFELDREGGPRQTVTRALDSTEEEAS